MSSTSMASGVRPRRALAPAPLALALLVPALLAPACGGALGRLPDREDPSAEEAAANIPERFPGPVWASHRQTGFLRYGVAVERREEDRATRVVYADGSDEWVTPGYLREDVVGDGAAVGVRESVGQPYFTAELSRRLGDAAFVRFRGGDEQWTTLTHLRLDEDAYAGQPPAEAPEAGAGTSAELSAGDRVLAEFQAEGYYFAATVTARRADGRLFVVYADGASEWIPPSYVRPDELRPGARVHFAPFGLPSRGMQWQVAEILEREGHALRLALQDGGVSWTSLARIRLPRDPEELPALPGPDEDAPPRPDDLPPAAAQKR